MSFRGKWRTDEMPDFEADHPDMVERDGSGELALL